MDPRSWRADPAEAPAGGMTAMGVHNVDAMIGLFGEIDEVYASSIRRTVAYNAEDTTSVIFGFANGMSGSLLSCLATAVSYRLAVFGSKGVAELVTPELDFRFTPTPDAMPTGRHTQPAPEVIENRGANTLLAELEAFADGDRRRGAVPDPRRGNPARRRGVRGDRPLRRDPSAGQGGARIRAEGAVKVETRLPLGKLDPGVRATAASLDIRAVADDARRAEALGYDGIITEETKDDPYIVMALAAQATSRVSLATAVALAFPRSPTVTAMTAWTLQRLSGGRFTLGLGSQVKGHIERRFGMSWSAPGPWLREYVQALRAIWDCWQNGTKLDFRGEHYKLNLMVPLFTPAPIEHPQIPVELAAVNPYMCQVAGEVADGIRAHPIATPRYIAETMLPAVRQGRRENRPRSRGVYDVRDAAGRDRRPTAPRWPSGSPISASRVAFYASTPSYLVAFESEGYGEVARNLQQLSRAQRWDEMAALVDDGMLDTYAVTGTYDEIAGQIARPLRRSGDRDRIRDPAGRCRQTKTGCAG